MDKIFKLKEHHTDVKTEILAGLTTFMTMAYVLAVQPGAIVGARGNHHRLQRRCHQQVRHSDHVRAGQRPYHHSDGFLRQHASPPSPPASCSC